MQPLTGRRRTDGLYAADKILFTVSMASSALANRRQSLLQDRGLNYGHGLFESMALHSAQVPLLQQHLQRLYQDAPKLGISLEAGSVEACLERFIAALLNGWTGRPQ